MMNNKDTLKNLTGEELEQKIKEHFLRRDNKQKIYSDYMFKYNNDCNEDHKELQNIYDEIESRKTAIDVSNLEGTRTFFEVEILFEKGKYPLSREKMKEWIKTLPGVKSVRVDDHEGEEIEESDWDYCFGDFFEDKRPA
jgi:hypothetical protein